MISRLVLAEDRWFRGVLSGIVLLTLAAWVLLALWPFGLGEVPGDVSEKDKGPIAACTADPDSAGGADAAASDPVPSTKESDAATPPDPAVTDDPDCISQVVTFINKSRAEGSVALPENRATEIGRLCAVGREGIEGLGNDSREVWLVAKGHIDCSLGEWIAVRTALYRWGLTSARGGWWGTMLLGIGLLGLALWFCWRAYATRRAVYWLDVSEHP